jgi:voltage-gated potassium channel
MPESPPLARLLRRVAVAIGLLTFVALIAYLDRDGYVDANEDGVSLLDAFYYATVSVTTTGYGDIRPESDFARLLSTLLVTPARVLFLLLVAGTAIEFLAGSTRERLRITRWRQRLRDHIIICGFGTKGRAAVRTMLARGHDSPEQFVVIDSDAEAREEARAAGFATIAGDATQSHVLHAAGIHEARAVVIAPDQDGPAVLMAITAREHNPHATIVAAVREEENVHLLKQSGADSVIVSSSSAGRLLGLATHAPQAVAVLEDLLTVGQGLDIRERVVEEHEAGPIRDLSDEQPIVAVVRDGQLLRYDDPLASDVRAGDRVVHLCSIRER